MLMPDMGLPNFFQRFAASGESRLVCVLDGCAEDRRFWSV